MSFPGFVPTLSFDEKFFSENSVQPFVDALVSHIRGGAWILLQGDLGAGKTTLVKKLVQTLAGISDVTSPTFPVLNVVDLPTCRIVGVKNFVHLDLYRLKTARELNFLGIENQVDDTAVVLVEWPEVVDGAEWEDFFETTRCQSPSVILDIHIHHTPTELNSRVYEFRVLEPRP